MSPSFTDIYLVAGKRTPFGKYGGSLAGQNFLDLLLSPAKALLTETKVNPELIHQVILGNVLPISSSSLYSARHLALAIGMKKSSTALMLNRLCGSGFEAIYQAMKSIQFGEADAILAGGVENLSACPHLMLGARFGTKFGAMKTQDFLLDTLSDSQCQVSMGETAEKLADEISITREESDLFSFMSHQKAIAAYNNHEFVSEIAPYNIGSKTLSVDEHVRFDTKKEDFTKLKPTFRSNGTVTPGSASGVVDGAAVVLIANKNFIEKNNLKPLAKLISCQVEGVEPEKMGSGPVPAITNLLLKNKLSLIDIDLFEINEAFASQALYCQKKLEIPDEKMNIWGGAVALGHPLGASGIRLSLTLAHQLKKKSKKRGVASACIGGGQGIALYMENV
jgi:acetyl-CoA acyltransferase 2